MKEHLKENEDVEGIQTQLRWKKKGRLKGTIKTVMEA